MEHYKVPSSDPTKTINSPLNPKGLKSAIALDLLLNETHRFGGIEAPLIICQTRFDKLQSDYPVFKNGFQTKHQHDGLFYHVWSDRSLIVGHWSHKGLHILPVALRASKNSQINKLPLYMPTTVREKFIHIEGLNFWFQEASKDLEVSRRIHSPVRPIWATLNWTLPSTEEKLENLVKDALAWIHLTTSETIEQYCLSYTPKTLTRTGYDNNLNFIWSYRLLQNINYTIPLEKTTTEAENVLKKVIKEEQAYKGFNFVQQQSHTKNMNDRQVFSQNPKIDWSPDEDSAHDIFQRFTRFKTLIQNYK